MTVCIAAFAAKSKAIVMVSDKALTYGAYGPTPMQSDTGVRKLLHLGNSGWEVLFSGNGAFAEKVVHRATQTLKDKPTIAESCQEMMECLRIAYQEVRETRVVDTILRPRLLDKDLPFKRNNQELYPLDESTVAGIWTELDRFNADCTMLVCGFDRDGPHIFVIDDPGILQSCDLPGFQAIGIGGEAATSRLLWEEVDRNDRLSGVLYETFHAKVQAEIIQGVGYYWDAYIIVQGKKLITVKWPILRALELIFEAAATSPFEKVKLPTEAKRKERIAKVDRFAQEALEVKPPVRKRRVARLKAVVKSTS